MPEATAGPPMPDTRSPDDRRALADSAVRVASQTGTPALTARVAMVPPNAPIPAINVRIRGLCWRKVADIWRYAPRRLCRGSLLVAASAIQPDGVRRIPKR